MSSPAPILVYGSDSRLLATRRMVLETLGGRVETALDHEQAKELLLDLDIELLVLCFTISAAERELVLQAARHRTPELKVLVLQGDGSGPANVLDDHFSIFAGPAKLKSKVLEMLERTAVLP